MEATIASIFDWSSTASSNTSCDGINTNTGMSPANVDNVFRSLMSVVRQTFASALQNFLAGTAALPIANGGTAATDAATALSNLGGLGTAYRDLPRVDKVASFTMSNSERGYGIFIAGTSIVGTLNPNATTPINSGAVFALYNGGSSAVTIARGSGVQLYVNGATTIADATLAAGGQATLIKWGTDVWTISGPGVS